MYPGSTGGGSATGWSPRAGSSLAEPSSPGATTGSLGSDGFAQEALTRVSLPHIMPLRDWELNLDALQVRGCTRDYEVPK